MRSIDFKKLVHDIPDPWQPRDIAFINDTALRIAKIDGEYHWHTHSDEDEFFFVLKGKMSIDTREGSVDIGEQEGFLIKKGIQHRSRAESPAWVLLIEPIKTKTKGEE